MERTSFSLSEEELNKINSGLEYGDNRSAWVRDAIRLKLKLIEEVEEIDTMTDEERREFVVSAVRESIED